MSPVEGRERSCLGGGCKESGLLLEGLRAASSSLSPVNTEAEGTIQRMEEDAILSQDLFLSTLDKTAVKVIHWRKRSGKNQSLINFIVSKWTSQIMTALSQEEESLQNH